MRIYLAALAVATLASGCASTGDVLSMPPSQQFSSAKNAIDLAACIGDLNNMPVQERSDGSRIVAIKAMAGNVGAVYTVKPDGGGSVVEVRKPGAMDISKFKRCL